MNPLSNLIKKVDTKQASRNVAPGKGRMRNNLQLNMSLVEEDTNELNETTRNQFNDSRSRAVAPSPRRPSPESQLPAAPRPPTSPILEMKRSQDKDTKPALAELPSSTTNKSQFILAAESLKSSSSSEASPRSSDESSEPEEGDPMKLSKRSMSKAKHSVRFSVMNVIIPEMPAIQRSAKLSMLPHRQLSFTTSFQQKVPTNGQPETYYECFEFAKKIMPRNSSVLLLFKKKAQGYIMYSIEPQLITSSSNLGADDNYTRSRNNTSLGNSRHRSNTPGTPGRRRLFSPAISPQVNKQIVFPSGEVKQALQSEFMVRAQQRVRMLKLLPQDLAAILTSSSEDGSSSEDDRPKKKKQPASDPKKLDIQTLNQQLEKHQEGDDQPRSPELDLPKKTKTFGPIIDRAAMQVTAKVPKIKIGEQKRHLSFMVGQIAEEEDELEGNQIRSLIRRRPQIQLSALTMQQRIMNKLHHHWQETILKLRPFLEDPEDIEERVHNGLSEKAALKLKVFTSIGLGTVVFFVVMLVLTFLMVKEDVQETLLE